jgi:cytochrome P450
MTDDDHAQFDHTTPEWRDHLCEQLEMFRSKCPFGHSSQHGGFWYALQPDMVRHVMNNPTTFVSSRGLSTPPAPVANTMIPINVDPPDLYEWRNVLNPRFAPQLMEAEAPRIRKEAFELFEAAAAKGCVDMVNDVAQPLTGMTTLRLIGLEPEDWHVYAEPFHALAFGTVSFEQAAVGMREMEARLRRDLSERIGTPKAAGLIKHLSEEARFRGRPITTEEIHNICLILLGGGLDTTQALVGSATVYLAEHPQRQAELVEHPERMSGAIEEFLRLWPPTQNLSREAIKDADLKGHPIKANERVVVSFVGANHDPTEFPNPYGVDFQREPNRHFSFGMGPHRCLGSHLARIEIRACLEALLSRARGFSIDRSKLQLARDISIFYGYESVEINLPRKAE